MVIQQNNSYKLKVIFILITAGLIFSGYLSAVKLFTATCAFGESCPYFLGYPACWYGFGMYLVMFISTVLGLSKQMNIKKVLQIDFVVSIVGVLFAGNFALKEIIASQATGMLGFSTCVYGLLFYILILIFSALYLRNFN